MYIGTSNTSLCPYLSFLIPTYYNQCVGPRKGIRTKIALRKTLSFSGGWDTRLDRIAHFDPEFFSAHFNPGFLFGRYINFYTKSSIKKIKINLSVFQRLFNFRDLFMFWIISGGGLSSSGMTGHRPRRHRHHGLCACLLGGTGGSLSRLLSRFRQCFWTCSHWQWRRP